MAEARKQAGVERVYENDRIRVTWEPRLCIHVGECFRTSPSVFQPRERPWVKIDAAEPDEIAETVTRCPTGALGVQRLDGGDVPEVPDPPEIEVDPEGTLFVRGHIRVTRPDGEVLREDTRVALCRCGHSKNKPFCDGTHWRVGFREDPPEAEQAEG